MQRVKSIDVFRGLAIVLMVLFTLMIKLSQEADFFEHNVLGKVNPGDFVLPLFLFASGMSLVYFERKHRRKKKIDFYLDVVERFGKLFGIGMLLSLFSAGQIFGMDEVSLSAILFALAMLAIRFSNFFYLVVSLILAILYFAVFKLGLITIFDSAYLGGYHGALFYLPVMLAGVFLGRGIQQRKAVESMKVLLMFAFVAMLILAFIYPIDKTRVSPSFMAISIVVGTVLFGAVHLVIEKKKLKLAPLEFLGRKPIRYWVLMFAFFIIPYAFCVTFWGCGIPLGYSLPIAIVICVIYMVFLAVVAGLIDVIRKKDQFDS